MLRTALGESTASLDSAGRSAQRLCPGGRAALRADTGVASSPEPVLGAEPRACGCGGASPAQSQGRAPSPPRGRPGASAGAR